MKCPECGTQLRSEMTKVDFDSLPGVTLIDVERRTCPEGHFGETVIPRIAQLHRVIAGLVAEKTQRLTGAEIRFLRKHLGWSAEDFSRTMGVRPETVSRWENEKEPMGATAERLLRLMALREKPIGEYPNERLAEVAQGDAEPVHVALTAAKSGWRTAEAA